MSNPINSSILLDEIISGKYDSLLEDIYIDRTRLDYERTRYIKAVEGFTGLYGEADVNIFSAPGRTEIGGNHTDHQHGQVLAASINNDAIAVASAAKDSKVMLYSEGYDMIELSSDELSVIPSEEGTTKALIRGVLAGMKNSGYKIGGFSAYVTSDVLSGSGLSSSAAFESLIGVIISGLYNDDSIDPVEIAKIGQFSENKYLGKPCGLMDQMASSVGSLCYIDFRSPAAPEIERIEFDLEKAGYSLCITDTKGSHADLTPDYAAVPAEMKAAAAVFGKEYLRDVPKEDILSNINKIRAAAGDRAALRAIHFAEETERARLEGEALRNGDFSSFLNIFRRSADSSYKYLQNVYTSSDVQHQNVSIGIAVSDSILYSGYPVPAENKGVVRVHGGGFAGTIQAFVKKENVQEYKEAMDSLFGDGACEVLRIRKYGCIRVI